MDKRKKKAPDYLRSLDAYLEKLTKEELYEFYLSRGFSDEDAMVLSGIIAKSDEDYTEAE